jgi:hypothetical protein
MYPCFLEKAVHREFASHESLGERIGNVSSIRDIGLLSSTKSSTRNRLELLLAGRDVARTSSPAMSASTPVAQCPSVEFMVQTIANTNETPINP